MMSRKLEDRSLRCRQSRCHNRLHDSRLSRSSRRTSCRHEPCHVYRHALSNQRTSVTSNVVGLCTCCFSPSSLSLICVDNSSSVIDSISGFSQQADDWKQLRQRQHEAAWLCVRRLEQANRLSTRQRPPARSPSSHRRDAAAAAEAVAMGNRHLLSGACELRPGNFIARVLFNKAVNSWSYCEWRPVAVVNCFVQYWHLSIFGRILTYCIMKIEFTKFLAPPTNSSFCCFSFSLLCNKHVVWNDTCTYRLVSVPQQQHNSDRRKDSEHW